MVLIDTNSPWKKRNKIKPCIQGINRQTNRRTDGRTDGRADKLTDRQSERNRYTETDTETDTQTNRPTYPINPIQPNPTTNQPTNSQPTNQPSIPPTHYTTRMKTLLSPPSGGNKKCRLLCLQHSLWYQNPLSALPSVWDLVTLSPLHLGIADTARVAIVHVRYH